MNKRLVMITAFAAVFSLLINCSNIAEQSDVKIAAVETGDTVTLTVGLNNISGRSAMPNVDLDDLTFISLAFRENGNTDDELLGFSLAGMWFSNEEMKQAKIPFKTGTFTFSLSAASETMVFSDEKTFTITAGSNNLTFTPRIEIFDSSEQSGKGNLNVTVRYDSEGVALVTGGLYSLDGRKISGYGDQNLTIEEGGISTYTKNNILSGNYILTFKFYADEGKKMLRGTYREYCSIVNGKTSSSECELEALGSIFNIRYELNGGMFSDGVTAAGSYTRMTDAVILPQNTESETQLTKSNCTFAGWYDNAEFTGLPVLEIPKGSTGDKTFYAKWLENAIITFAQNDTGASIGINNQQQVQKGVETNLRTAADLLLVTPAGKRFLGWATTSNAGSAEYFDGGAITVSSNVVLYAIWSVSPIDPSGEDDPTDTDKDGISDWDELHKYFTDPSNPDTDGDGWTDSEEKTLHNENTNTFNPLIADTPALEVKFAGKPVYEYTYTVSENKSKSETVSNNEGVTGSESSTSSNTKTRNETHAWSLKFGFSEKWGEKGFEFGLNQEIGISGSVTSGDSYTYSSGTSSSWSKSWSNGKTIASTSGKNISGGDITIPFKFKNPSSLAYTVKSVTIAINTIPVGSETATPLTSITRTDVGTIAPGAESGVFNIKFSLTLDAFEKAMKWSTGLIMEVSGYTITMFKDSQSAANDFTQALTKVKAQTAAIYIDWGNTSGRNAKTYNVAVKNQYNKDATSINTLYDKNNLEYIFQNILNMEKNRDYILADEGYLKSMNGIANAADRKDGAWFICHKYNKDGQRVGKIFGPYSESDQDKEHWRLSDIELSAGDEVSIIYSVDKDGDGVPLNEELIAGTSDNNADTDGDGLKDGEEIYGWYKGDIGLVSKYSETSKVYSNPLINDTDGDDLLDYSTDASLQDNDPLDPKLKTDTSFSVMKCKNYKEDVFYDFRTDGNVDYDYIAPKNFDEYACLDIQPKYAFATVKYSLQQGGPYSEFDSTTEIKLNVGNNYIYVQSTAPDGVTKKEYKFVIISKFRDIKQFNADSPLYGGGKVNFVWDSYSDERCSASDGGYVIWAKKEASLSKDPILLRSDAMNAPTTALNLAHELEFFLKVDAASLQRGNLSITDVAPHTYYSFYLFCYAHSENSSTYAYKQLCAANLKTGVTRNAKLKFYAHYIYGESEHDAGSEGEYYWTFSDDSGFLGLNDLSHSSKEDLGNGDCYSFGKGTHHSSRPTKFGENTKTFEHQFERGKGYSFTIYWEAKEDDPCNTDYLGKVTASFSYDSRLDQWTCSYSASGGDGCGASKNAGSKTIAAGERTDGMYWPLYNSDKGEIAFYCDMGWDEN
ncbi:MAG: InlB B-repeat-containing protein [Spirochaetales bacterium]|nr:InlB B-repeat-containing protein [Spirochaetales bacterium]